MRILLLLQFLIAALYAGPAWAQKQCRQKFPFLTEQPTLSTIGGLDFTLYNQVFDTDLRAFVTPAECKEAFVDKPGEYTCLANYRIKGGGFLTLVHLRDQFDDETLSQAFELDVLGKPAYVVPFRLDEVGVDTAYTLNNDGSMYGLSYSDKLATFDGVAMAALFPLILRSAYVCSP